jgi:hypothetical protein
MRRMPIGNNGRQLDAEPQDDGWTREEKMPVPEYLKARDQPRTSLVSFWCVLFRYYHDKRSRQLRERFSHENDRVIEE